MVLGNVQAVFGATALQGTVIYNPIPLAFKALQGALFNQLDIYPHTKLGNERMVEILKEYGSEHIIVDSAADWGISDALAVPKTAALMKEHGISLNRIEKVTYANPLAAYGQSGQIHESDWDDAEGVDPKALFEGNTLLRGGQDIEKAMSGDNQLIT